MPTNVKGRVTYPNLRAEMGRKGVTITDLSNFLNLRIATVSIKLRKRKLTLDEAVKIKGFLNVDMSLEELYSDEEIA